MNPAETMAEVQRLLAEHGNCVRECANCTHQWITHKREPGRVPLCPVCILKSKLAALNP